MIRKKAKEGYLLVYKTDEYITVTPAVSAPDGTVLTDGRNFPRWRRENWNGSSTRKRIQACKRSAKKPRGGG